MGKLVLKTNIGTAALAMSSAVLLMIYSFSTKPVECDTQFDGHRYLSCGENATEFDDNNTNLSIYRHTHIFLLLQAMLFVIVTYLLNNCASPFVAKNFIKKKIQHYTKVEELVEEVKSYLMNKLDTSYLLKEVFIYLIATAYTLSQLALSYLYIVWCSADLGLTVDEGLTEVFPSVKKCRFDDWPFELNCELKLARINQVVFFGLWVLYALVAFMYFVNFLRHLLKLARRAIEMNFQPPLGYSSLELWLFFICEGELRRLNQISEVLGLKDFWEATFILVDEPVIYEYFSEKYGFCWLNDTDMSSFRGSRSSESMLMETSF